MPPPRNDNPDNSTFIEYLRAALANSPTDEYHHAARAMLEQAQAHLKDGAAKADEAIAHRGYNPQKIAFGRRPTINRCPAATELLTRDPEARIFDLLASSMEGVYRVSVSYERIMRALKITARRVKPAMEWLLENGYIAYETKGKAGRGSTPAVYMINPIVAATGKIEREDTSQADFWRLAGRKAKSNFELINATRRWQAARKSASSPKVKVSQDKNGDFTDYDEVPERKTFMVIEPYTPILTPQKEESPALAQADDSEDEDGLPF